MKTKLRRALFIIGLEAMTVACLMASAFAVTITAPVNLTSFASGDTTTHSHVWVQKYDSAAHWEQCSMCGTKRNEKAHTLTASYSLGAGNCNRFNVKTVACNGCAWTKTEQVASRPGDTQTEGFELEHEFAGYVYNYLHYSATTTSLSELHAYAYCSRCKDAYGPVYTTQNGGITDQNGNPIDMASTHEPVDLYVKGQLMNKRRTPLPKDFGRG